MSTAIKVGDNVEVTTKVIYSKEKLEQQKSGLENKIAHIDNHKAEYQAEPIEVESQLKLLPPNQEEE